uniref:Uncharacterized protein n=1 Tax=Lepeophtheirus salmonis TaxID=72036 RepID=A0A0K2V919_LEPSM
MCRHKKNIDIFVMVFSHRGQLMSLMLHFVLKLWI